MPGAVTSAPHSARGPGDAAGLPVTALKGVGPRLAARLARLGVHRVLDLLLHMPLRYQDRTRVVRIGAARAGEEVVVEGEVQHTAVINRRRRALLCRISDGSGSLTLRFFHFGAGLHEAMRRGRRLRCFGELRPGANGPELIHPEVAYDPSPDEAGPTLTPVYPTTDGLHQLTLRRLVDEALTRVEAGEMLLPELLPPALRADLEPAELARAVVELHRPASGPGAPAEAARRRLAFEELLAHNLSLAAVRARARAAEAPALGASGALRRRLLASLEFAPTAAQARVVREIDADMARRSPMLRLLQGDVGSGKTVVAALAATSVLEAGCQAAVMAPTELLAEQHARNFAHWFEPLGVGVAWVAGKAPAAQRRVARQAVASGAAGIAVGTHALFQRDVEFAELALVVIDEQHRFGVHQRLALREKGTRGARQPHQLIMTATPIPRTLAMTAYADLDCSTIDELPPGRTPVRTAVLSEHRRTEIVARIREVCAAGRQAYWVCPLVEESEVLQAQAAEQTAVALREQLPGLEVGLVHGRMKGDAKEREMRRFEAGAVQLLVATTVVEVGVDVPNASLMIIENAERLGLAQLHQLRGRVGRGAAASSCLLLYKPPLGETARARLQTLRASNDGFHIAQKDLEMRGPGELLGARQAGQMAFRIADLQRDADQIARVRDAARLMHDRHPEAIEPLLERWLPGREDYASA